MYSKHIIKRGKRKTNGNGQSEEAKYKAICDVIRDASTYLLSIELHRQTAETAAHFKLHCLQLALLLSIKCNTSAGRLAFDNQVVAKLVHTQIT